MTRTADGGPRRAARPVDPRLDRVARKAMTGDRDALTTVYQELSPVVCGYLRARGASDPEALTNEVFIQVIRRVHALPTEWQGLKTFVFRAAHSRLVDERRRTRTRGDHVAYDPEGDQRQVASAEEAALQALSQRELMTLLELLPTDQRSVVTLRFLADLSLHQTAEVMNRSVSLVGRLQSRALTTLRDYLGPQGRPAVEGDDPHDAA